MNLSKIIESYPSSNQYYDEEKSYHIFKIANQNRSGCVDNLNEFYMSYVFARNIMCSMFILLGIAIVLGMFYNENDISIIKAVLVIILFLVLFIYRWRQKAIYYSIKILSTIS